MLSVDYQTKESVMIVKLEGELMLENVNQLKHEFDDYQSSFRYFLFDFTNVKMIDSSGLGYIVYCLKKLRKKNGDVKIHNLENQAKLIFEITRVNSILDIYDSEIEALKSFEIMENDYESNSSNSNEIIA